MDSKQPEDRLIVTLVSVNMISSTLSVYGALVQLINWWKRLRSSEPRRIPSPTPHIIFSLALADLLACIGVLARSVVLITYKSRALNNDGIHNATYALTYGLTRFINFSYLSSFMWTLIYSVDICLQIHNQHHRVRGITYHIFAWLIPASAVVFAETGKLLTRTDSHFLEFYVLLCFTAMTLPVIYLKAYYKVARNIRSGQFYTDVQRNLQKLVRRRFLLIVVAFYICWITHTIHWILSGELDLTNYFVLWLLDAALTPLQGLLNCLVYGQQKQFTNCCRQSLEAIRGQKDSETKFSTIETHTTRTLSDEWNINSFNKRASLPYTCPPCLANKSLYGSTDNAEKPFVARLLGEYSSCT